MSSVLSRFLSLAVLVLAILGGPLAAPARSEPDAAAPLIAAARQQDLSASPTWRKLGHYQAAGRSDVVSQRFFLAPTGDRDPAAELDATLTAMIQPVGASADDHAQCRFPARFQWLSGRIAWPADMPRVACPRLDAWRQHGAVGSVSLIFVSGNLANPASFYGHILLKFNEVENAPIHGLLDSSLNYGALIPEGEGGVKYLLKGVSGGYSSSFTNLTFYNHSHRYAETELRNLWEYQLDLPPDRVALLLNHAWEMMAQENRYFFLKQNCAYRMAELANLVVDEPLLPDTKAWATPVDVFARLTAAQQDGRPLVARVRRIPSRQAVFREAMIALPPEGRSAVRAFVETPRAPSARVEPALGAPVLETLIDYYTFLEIRSKAEKADATATKNQLLLARLRLPAAARPEPARAPAPPHAGQRSSMLQASLVSNDRLGESLELRLRGAHHDFLSYAPGVPANSELTLVDIRLAARRSGLELRELEAVRITALKLSETGLPGDGGRAWRMRFGAEARDLACTDCLVGYVEGGLGKAASLGASGGDQTAAYVFLNGRANLLGPDGASLQAGPTLGLLFGPGRAWRGKLEAGVSQEIGGPGRTRPTLAFETRFGGQATWDIRAGVRAERLDGRNVVESRIGLARFW